MSTSYLHSWQKIGPSKWHFLERLMDIVSVASEAVLNCLFTQCDAPPVETFLHNKINIYSALHDSVSESYVLQQLSIRLN